MDPRVPPRLFQYINGCTITIEDGQRLYTIKKRHARAQENSRVSFRDGDWPALSGSE